MTLQLPELWDPVGTPVTRDFTDLEIKRLGLGLMAFTADLGFESTRGAEILQFGPPGDGYHIPPGMTALLLDDIYDADSPSFFAVAETEEEARRMIVQEIVDGLRKSLAALLVLRGPKPHDEPVKLVDVPFRPNVEMMRQAAKDTGFDGGGEK